MTNTRSSLSCRYVPRAQAIEELAGQIRGQGAHVIGFYPHTAAAAADRLADIEGCTFYADDGTDVVMLSGHLAGKAVAVPIAMFGRGPFSLVGLVPTSVSAQELSAALADGRRELLTVAGSGGQIGWLVTGESGQIDWPRLLVDAAQRAHVGTLEQISAGTAAGGYRPGAAFGL